MHSKPLSPQGTQCGNVLIFHDFPGFPGFLTVSGSSVTFLGISVKSDKFHVFAYKNMKFNTFLSFNGLRADMPKRVKPAKTVVKTVVSRKVSKTVVFSQNGQKRHFREFLHSQPVKFRKSVISDRSKSGV